MAQSLYQVLRRGPCMAGFIFLFKVSLKWVDFPDSSVGKESACNVVRPGFDPWVGKITWRRERLPTPGFWPGEFHGLYSTWGHKESDTTEQLSLHFTSHLQEGLNWKKINNFLSTQHTTELERERRVKFQHKKESFKFEILKTSMQKNHLKCWLQRQIPKTLSWWVLNGDPESEF